MAARVSSPFLVGRGGELAQLTEALDRALAGRPGVCLLRGDAGVGKSRLARELNAAARARGALVLRGECVEFVRDELPYAPLVAALRDAGDAVARVVDPLPAAARAELGRLLPTLVDDVSAVTIDELGRTRLFELLCGVLRGLAAEGGLVLTIEDLHWADSSTRSFLGYLARNLRDQRLLVIATWRTDEPAADDVLHGLERVDGVQALHLAPLARDEVAQLIGGILGHAPDRATVDEIDARAQGNPFDAEELLALRAGGSAALPEHVRESLLLRVQHLPQTAQDLVRALAAFGRPARQELLGAVTGVPEPELSRQLRKAVAAHVITHEAAGDCLDFRHALVREAAYRDLMPGERVALHAAIAEALSALPEPAGPAELAYHWRHAGRREAARAASVAAGLSAAKMRAFDEAHVHFTRALELWGEPAPDAGPDRVEVLGHAAEAARFRGEHRRAVELCRQALDELDPEAEPVRAAWFYERIGRYCFWEFETSIPAFREALRLLPDEPRADRARVLGDEGLALMSMVRYEPARERCEEAIAVARRAGATLEEAYARITLGLDLAYLGDLDEAERQVREGMRIAGEHEYAEDLARGYISLSEVLRLRGRVEDALAVAREGAREAKRLGVDASFGRSMDANAAEDLVRLGRWEEAQESLAALATVQLSRVGAVMHAATAGHLATARGDFALAREHFAAAWAEGEQGVPPEFVPTLATGPAALALALGEPDEARGHVSRALPLVENSEERLYTSMLFAMTARVEADLAERDRLRDPAAAAEHAAAATRIVDALERRLQGPPAPPPIAVAHLAECRAECTRAAGASAAAAWHDCAERWDDLGFRPSAAYARFRLAEALLAGGAGRADAAAVLRVAARAAEGLGARPLAREIAALAQRARLDLAEPEPAPAAEPRVPEAAARLGLTRRELEVLALVAEGLTNQEIADRLFISVSTAGVHISHILGKLHVRKRLDAATLAHRSGLLSASERSVAS